MHDQAFHTSTRAGLTGRPGFQFSARSTGLSNAALSDLAARLAGYTVPSDMPPEPGADELAHFPVALEYADVPSTGPALARTVYVGREFRGSDGESDSGRFGNYFTHMLVPRAGGEPFDGLLPIELWDASHWTSEDARSQELPPVGALSPGPLTLERAAELLGRPERAERLATVVGAAAEALAGGRRVVVVDQPGEPAAAWVAICAFALPRHLAERLTFTTYAGRPRTAIANVAVTTAGCDTAFAAHELHQSVVLVDVLSGAGACETTLFGRAAAELLSRGAEALSAAVARLDRIAPGLRPDEVGARLVLAGPAPGAVTAADVSATVRLVAEEIAAGGSDAERAAELAETLVDTAPGAAEDAPAWLELHRRARAGTGPAAAVAASAALRWLVPRAISLPPAEDVTPSDAPTPPGEPGLAAAFDLLAAMDGPADLAAAIAALRRLGVLAVNGAVDEAVARACATYPQDARPAEALLCDPALERVVARVAARLAEAAVDDEAAFATLRSLAGASAAFAGAVENAARDAQRFDLWLVASRLRVLRRPDQRRDLAVDLLRRAPSAREREQVMAGLYHGMNGSAREVAERLEVCATADVAAPPAELEHAWAVLRGARLRVPYADVRTVLDAVANCDPLARRHPLYRAFDVMSRGGAAGDIAEVLEMARDEFSPEQLLELRGGLVRELLAGRHPADHVRGVVRASEILGPAAGRLYASALEETLERKPDPELAAVAFVAWRVLADRGPHPLAEEVLERALPRSLATWSDDDRAKVGAVLPEPWKPRWDEWREEHPGASGVGRTMRRVLRRRR